MFNKENLINTVHADNGGSRASAERIVDLMFVTLKGEINKGKKVSIAGFGIFIKKAVKAKMARNPATGEKVKVAAHNKIKFAPAKGFKEFINNK